MSEALPEAMSTGLSPRLSPLLQTIAVITNNIVPTGIVSAYLSLAHLSLCLLLMALFLQLPISQKRLPRTLIGLFITTFTLTTNPRIYASETQPFGVILAYICCGVAWTLLYWTLMEPLNRQPTVLEVMTSYIRQSAYGARKGYAKYQRSLAGATRHAPQGTAPAAAPAGAEPAAAAATSAAGTAAAGTAARRPELHAKSDAATDNKGVCAEGPWVFAVLKVVDVLLRLSLLYDVIFIVFRKTNPTWCDSSSNARAFASVHAAAAAAAGRGFLHVSFAKLVAYLQLCVRGFLPFSLLILAIDIGYCCINLSVNLAAAVVPQLRSFAVQLPYHAVQSPWAASSLKDYWGFRWQQFHRFYFERLGYPAVDALLPAGTHVAVRISLRTAAAFFMTGLTHEYINWAAFGNFSGCYFAFFGLHCLAVLLEGWGMLVIVPALHKIMRARRTAVESGSRGAESFSELVAKSGSMSVERISRSGNDVLVRLLKPAWVWSVLVLASPLFFEPMRAGGFYSRAAYHPFGKPVVPRLLSWLGAQEYAQLGFAADGFAAAAPA